jgi:hypothetical protein
MAASQVVAFVQAYEVAQDVERPDGLYEYIVVPMSSRVDDLCLDSPRWSARDETTNWRVFAECAKREDIPGDNPLQFEWLVYPDMQLVMPFSHPAHVAQYQYPW